LSLPSIFHILFEYPRPVGYKMASSNKLKSTDVDKRLETIKTKIEDLGLVNRDPGIHELHDLLFAYFSDTGLDNIDFLRHLPKVYLRDTDDAYQNFVNKNLTKDEKDRLDNFVVHNKSAKEASCGFELLHSFGVRDGFETLRNAKRVTIPPAPAKTFFMRTSYDTPEQEVAIHGETVASEEENSQNFARMFARTCQGEATNDVVKIWDHGDSVEFNNWGRTVQYKPSVTVWARTVDMMSQIVQYAVKCNLGVRCSGYRHSWSPIFGRDGQVLLTTIDPDIVDKLPNFLALPLSQNPPTELETIDFIETEGLVCTPGKKLVSVGAGATNERLCCWSIQNGTTTLPLNVIMVEITLGGSNAPICHGAGLKQKTLSDLVRAVEYIDCHGVLQCVTDTRQLRAASGCFGLMGIVTRLTLEFDPVSYAVLAPVKRKVAIAIPPPDGYEDKIPEALQVKCDPAQRLKDIEAFENACSNDYYCEWFWFPYSDQAWVNTWKNTEDSSNVQAFPSTTAIFLQWTVTVLFNIAQNEMVLDKFASWIGINYLSCTVISRAAMGIMYDSETHGAVKAYLPDALHFQRAIQNLRVRDMEVEIPIPNKQAGTPNIAAEPDWGFARRTWWDAIIVAYANEKTQPQRMPLEMRIMGDSNVIMAPQRGNVLGTCSIEVLTLGMEKKKWPPYSQQILDVWTSYKDAAGMPLRTRPHWAKEWAKDLQVDGQDWKLKLKRDYRDEIIVFKEVLEEIGKKDGWTLKEIQERFSNDFDEFIFT
jgi:hypothetical protein